MRIAAVQMDVELADTSTNLHRIDDRFREARRRAAQLVVFPECAVTGYCYENLADALSIANPVPGPITEELTALCQSAGGFLATGLLERDGQSVYNACLLVGPRGVVGHYRKTHLPYLGVDRFATAGDEPYRVVSIDDVRLGMLICYDASFPEATRVLTLQGADLVILPTNWPPGAEIVSEHAIPTRAAENKIYMLSANRVGTEGGFRFIGHSSICDVHGHRLAYAPHEDEVILYADIDPALARTKRIERAGGAHVIDRMADRRPDLYGPLAEPKTP